MDAFQFNLLLNWLNFFDDNYSYLLILNYFFAVFFVIILKLLEIHFLSTFHYNKLWTRSLYSVFIMHQLIPMMKLFNEFLFFMIF